MDEIKSVKKMKKFIELLRNKEYKNELICDQKMKKIK